MSVSYQDKDHIYAVARIRSAELKLFDRSVFDRLCEAESHEESIAILSLLISILSIFGVSGLGL